MKRITFLTAIFFSLILILPVGAQEDIKQQKDSILRIIPTLTDGEKLEAYENLGKQLFFHEGDTTEILPVFRAWEREAEKQGNVKLQRRVMYFSLGILVNRNYTERFLQEVDRFFTFAEQHDLYDDNYYAVHNSKLINLYELGRINESLQETKLLYEVSKKNNRLMGRITALFCMAEVYSNLRKFTEAEKCYKECLEIILDKETSTSVKNTISSSYFGLIELYLLQKQNEKASDTLDNWEEYIHKIDSENESLNDYNWKQYYFMRAFAYTQVEDAQNAVSCLQKADSIQGSYDGIENPVFRCQVRALVLELQGQYKEALEMIEQSIMGGKNPMVNAGIMSDKARILCKAGRGIEAYPLLFRAQEIRDSIQSLAFNAELDELRTVYEVDKITTEKEKKQQQVLLAVFICALLFVALFIYILYSRRLQQRNLALYQQVQELSRKEKAVETCFLSKPEETLSKEMLLFRQLSERMKAEKLFTDTDINRKKLADLLGTNETYLANAIRQGRAETFSDYISNLRLQYAVDLMEEHPEMTFDSIAVDSGYGSYSQFFRLFSRKYGITPSEYRKMLVKKSQHKNITKKYYPPNSHFS